MGAITPWSQTNMVRTCGDANINAYTISREIGAPKFAVITRDRSNMDDWWYPFPYVLPGYYEGKRKIEEFVANDVQNAGNAICLRAGFVVGTRRTLPGLPHVGEDCGAAGRLVQGGELVVPDHRRGGAGGGGREVRAGGEKGRDSAGAERRNTRFFQTVLIWQQTTAMR